MEFHATVKNRTVNVIDMTEVECHISIRKNGVTFLNPLKTELLKKIRQNGSLNGASKAMNISYQHLWTMIEEMNQTAPSPLVLKQRGGTNGGGTAVSAYGEQMLKEYFIIQPEIKKVVDQIYVEINI